MYEVNRSVAVIRPKAPFLEWLTTLPGGVDAGLTLEILGQNSNALLVPPADDPEAMAEFIQQQYQLLFEAELADWCEDPACWPSPLSPELFTQWFEISIHPIVTDMVDTPLEREPFIPLDMHPE